MSPHSSCLCNMSTRLNWTTSYNYLPASYSGPQERFLQEIGRWKESSCSFVACTCRHLYVLTHSCSHRSCGQACNCSTFLWSYFSFPDFWTMCVFNSMTKGHMSNFCRSTHIIKGRCNENWCRFWSTPWGPAHALGPVLAPPPYIHFLSSHCLPCADMKLFYKSLCSCGSQEIFQISKRFSKSLISKDTSSSNIQDVNIHGFLWEFNLWNNKGIELGTKALSWDLDSNLSSASP